MYTAKLVTDENGCHWEQADIITLWEAMQDADHATDKLEAMINILMDATTGGNVIDEKTLAYYTMSMRCIVDDLRQAIDAELEAYSKAPECCNTEGQA